MKKLFAVIALAAFVTAVSAQEPKPAAKKEACCKKEATAKMACDKDSKKDCCKKKMTEAKKTVKKA
jgi:hypothetical protein